MISLNIFHYNDEETQLHRWLAERGHFNTVVAADRDPFEIAKSKSFDAAFIGLHPHGLALIKELHRANPDCLVTMITADRDTRKAVECMRAGALDYLLSPPLDFTDVERAYILLNRQVEQQVQRRRFEDQLAIASGSTRLVGNSKPIEDLRRLITKVARTRAPVLLSGETGTGKELVARLIHEQGPRSSGPFVAVNCNAIPSALLESELFGHKKGSFTGADRNHPGLLVEATGGTFFLDEIHDLEMLLQGKLLRILQEEEVRPVGSASTMKLDTRFIAAAGHDLAALIDSRKFRSDLFYRLNVVPIRIPPLRDRIEDIPLLARHFIDLYSAKEGREPLKISPAVWQWMNDHQWPGNIRELENLCQRAVALTDGDTFDTDVLALTNLSSQHPHALPFPPSPSIAGGNIAHDYLEARQLLDRQMLERALRAHEGNILRTAKSLRISRTTFYSRARKLGVHLEYRHQ